jgi:hypothetical protein
MKRPDGAVRERLSSLTTSSRGGLSMADTKITINVFDCPTAARAVLDRYAIGDVIPADAVSGFLGVRMPLNDDFYMIGKEIEAERRSRLIALCQEIQDIDTRIHALPVEDGALKLCTGDEAWSALHRAIVIAAIYGLENFTPDALSPGGNDISVGRG